MYHPSTPTHRARRSMQNRRTSKLRERADIIRDSVNKTADHLQEQTFHTTKLVQQALSLVKAVSVFKLKVVDKEIPAVDLDTEESDRDMNTNPDTDTNTNTETDKVTDTEIMSNSTIQEKTEKINLNMDLDIKLDE